MRTLPVPRRCSALRRSLSLALSSRPLQRLRHCGPATGLNAFATHLCNRRTETRREKPAQCQLKRISLKQKAKNLENDKIILIVFVCLFTEVANMGLKNCASLRHTCIQCTK